MEFTYSKFIEIWHIVALVLAGVSVIGSILIFIVHKLRLSSITDYKQKYDYLGAYDSKMVFYVIVSFAV